MSVATLGYGDLPALLGRLTGDEKHSPSAHSTLDVLWVLYDRVLRVSPAFADDPARDRFLLSKGHGPMAYYAVLAAKGFIPVDELDRFGDFDSRLGYHPDHVLIPGVEISSGSLGHGLGLGVGMVLGLRALGLTQPRVVVLVGDAELDEASNHEAIHFAGARGLGALTAVVIDNHSRSYPLERGLGGLFEVAGWDVREVSGRDHAALQSALTATSRRRPSCVVAAVEPAR
ncbi:MAG: transketolase [Chloroflexi bacterium]|nr:MAG: transketolase [Chloroflexota bacterium]